MKDLYSDNLEKVMGVIEDLYKDEQTYKKTWAVQARRNVAFANGDQDPLLAGAGPVMVNNNPVNYRQDNRFRMYFTNEIEPIIRTLVSYMTRSKPTVNVEPADERDAQDRNISKIAEKISEAKYDIDKEYNNSKNSAFWALTTGNVFGKDYWDYGIGDYRVIQNEDGSPVFDKAGEVETADDKLGSNNTAILTAMTVSVDHTVTDFYEQPWIGESYIMDVDWAREAFDVDAPGYTGKSSKIEEDGYTSDTLSTFEEMKFSIPYRSMGSKPSSKGKCLVREWYIRPNKEYKKGRLIIIAGGQVVYSGESPYFMPYEPVMWHPYTMFGYEPYVGRFLNKSLVEQLVPLQIRLNEINGAILENANTLAKPNILAAENQLRRGIVNGHGANIYTYKVIPGAPPPTGMQGYPLPSQFFKEKQDLITQMVRIAGTNFVMQGQPPTGVTAASAIDQLLENANSQHSDMMISWSKYHEERYTKKLRLIHRFNTRPDQALNRKLVLLAENSLDTEIEDFIGARDLSDGINIKIQQGSMIPKSQYAKNSLLKELAGTGMLSPFLGEDSPRGEKMRAQLLEKFELEPLDNDESIDFKKARWENDLVLQGKQIAVNEFDIDDIHLSVHKTLLQDPKFIEKANQEQYQQLKQHIVMHEQRKAEQEQQMEQKMMAQGMPPQGQAPQEPQVPPEGAPGV